MRLLALVVLLAACGGGFGGQDVETADMSAAPTRANYALLAEDMSLPSVDMTWDPSAYPDVCNSGCPGGTGGHSLK